MAKYVGTMTAEERAKAYTEHLIEQERRQQRLEAARLADQMARSIVSYRPLPIPPELKENTVPTESTVDTQIKAELRKRRDEREVAKRLALVDAFGEDPFDPGTVLTFVKKFASAKDKPYTYAAIKADEGDKWFITGHDCYQGTTLTWDGLIEFLVTGPYPVASVTVKVEGGDVYPSAGNVYPTASKDK